MTPLIRAANAKLPTEIGERLLNFVPWHWEPRAVVSSLGRQSGLAHLRTQKVFHGRMSRRLKQAEPLSIADVL
jgi:hypothetical protein